MRARSAGGMRLTALSLTRTRFRVGGPPTAINAKARPRTKVGTIIRFTLSETATVKLAIVREQRVRGNRKSSKKKAKAKLVASGTLTRAGRRGTNLVAFSGRVGRRKLRPGTYRFLITATDAAGNRAKTLTIRFTVVSR
jgi:hypothetical protein